MLLYIAANNRAVNVVVVVERLEAGKEHPLQRPVYYVSEVLTSSKQRYPHWQKLVLGVFMVSRKLKHYFQEHPMTVVSSAPLADIIQNREATGRIAKWAIELGAYHVKYESCTAIRSQALADFINDWTEIQAPQDKPVTKYWTMHFDGSRQLQGSGASVVLTSCRDPGFAYVIPVTMQSHGEPRDVPTCVRRQGQAQNTLGKHRT